MKHFAVDIDGCITNGKGVFTSSESASLIQELIKKRHLSFFLCTGRSAPYVEAISQLLSINQYCICENGSYLYNPMSDDVLYNPSINKDTLDALFDISKILKTNKYKEICKVELGKSVCISLNPRKGDIENLYSILFDEIDHDLLYINHSTTAVDITPKGVDKGSALRYLCKIEGYDLKQIVSIGDSSGDLPFMTLSGTKTCPQNASSSVKEICGYVSSYNTTKGVIDIIKKFS